MTDELVVQGRRITPGDLEQIQELMRTHPEWSRRRLSEALTAAWDWRNPAGRLKDMATRTLLVKLEARGLIQLPARRRQAFNRMARPRTQPRLWDPWDRTPLSGSLAQIGPRCLREVSGERVASRTAASIWTRRSSRSRSVSRGRRRAAITEA